MNGHRLQALVAPEPAGVVKIDGRTCMPVTHQRPLTDLRAFEGGSLMRPVSPPGKPHLCALVKMRLIDHGCARYVEANVYSVSFWSAHEADLFWKEQLYVTRDEAEACEVAALAMV